MADSDGTLTVSDLEKLPSRDIYNKFDGAWNEYGNRYQFEQGTKEKLSGFDYIGNDADKIMGAWCYTFLFGTGGTIDNDLCYYFYFWLGDILWNKSGTPELFSKNMNEAYSSLTNSHYIINCELIHKTNIAKELFYQMKKTYEFFKDRNRIQQQLMTHKYRCTPHYARYLQSIVEAYANVRIHCNLNGQDTLCKKFEKEFRVGKYEEVAKFKCASVHRSGATTPYADALQFKADVSPSPRRNNTISAAVLSAAAALLGVPLVSFFLYKYNLLPDWIHNQFGNNNSRSRRNARRKKRRSTIKHEFDTSTEDSSTLYSTVAETSTIGSTAIADPSEYSIPSYTIPPSNRGTAAGRTNRTKEGTNTTNNNNNNTPPGHHHQNKNIRYHRM